ncbi:MAG: 23S rRNA (uracil(1939)-C(5))-methyltransferase RlmD [Pseudomonadota bacterium]|jgi:23S rRNA (uracil1939-C5)-methyltransferase
MGYRGKRKPLPDEPVAAHIESFAHDGRGIAHVDGRVVFVDGALPGEDVTFVYTEIKRDYAAGRAEEIVTASPDRVPPRCRHFALCGGCSLQYLSEDAQIALKEDLLLEQFRRIGKVEPAAQFPPLRGPHWGYRSRARLGARYVAKKGRELVGFREHSSAKIVDMTDCPVLHPALGERIEAFAELIEGLSLRERLPQIEAAVGEERTALVFRVLEDPTPKDFARLAQFGEDHGLDVYIQREGRDSVAPVYPETAHDLSYSLPEWDLIFRFGPLDFTQVNMAINRQMIGRVMQVLDPQPDDRVLDLFCGLGNFTLPLARRAAYVTGVEGGGEAVARAIRNAADNGIGNVEFHLADLSKPENCGAWAGREYDKVLLDPSRAGALEILQCVPKWKAGRIVYVSCNPSTLARDAGVLVHEHGYRLLQAGVMDMFPHTAHVESIALFER